VNTALRSGEVAAAAGVNLQTLRYYERRGLLAAPARTAGGHRLYPADTVTLLRVIKAAQRLGFTLNEIADLVQTAAHGHQAGRRGRADGGLRSRAAAKLAEIDRRLADLTVIRGVLQAAVDAGCDDLLACAEQPCCPLPFAELADRDADPAAEART
jgi:DNA-binding transcriptional MerR regulator